MPGLPIIKATTKLLVNQGRACEVDSFVESAMDGLSTEEQAELRAWLMSKGASTLHDDSLPRVESNWKRVARHMRGRETLRDVYPRLPEELQEFLRDMAGKRHHG